MIQPIAYIETTIPSFYHEVRTSPDIVARRDWTRTWWGIASARYRLVTSEAVIRELEGGIEEHAKARLGLVSELTFLPIDPEIKAIVRTYIRHQLMPANPTGDALHLALASYHKCDFLVTWNCLHLANANKFGHIRRINTMLGLFVPTIATPLELMGGIDVGKGPE
jgi:predicted nucleic acid-binding protein